MINLRKLLDLNGIDQLISDIFISREGEKKRDKQYEYPNIMKRHWSQKGFVEIQFSYLDTTI